MLKNMNQTKKSSGFSLIEIIVAMAILAVLASAIVPVVFNRLEQARYERTQQDLQAIYEAMMGIPAEDYFGYVGDVGQLPDSIPELLDGTGQGTLWSGPYLSLGGNLIGRDIYGSPYVIDSLPIRSRSWGQDRADNSGAGDDLFFPENALNTYKGQLEVQVLINGRLIADAAQEQVTANLAFADNGTPDVVPLTFSTGDMHFTLPAPVHQGKHVLTVNAAKATQDPATEIKEVVTIYPGAVAKIQVTLEDADYMTRLDTDLNNNDLPDRLEDMDGDGIPNSMDADIDGDGASNVIEGPDSLDPTVIGTGGGTAVTVSDVTPNYGYQEDTGLSLTVEGSNFQSGAIVTFSGTGITVQSTTYNSTTQLTVVIDIGAAATTGYRDVTVTNTDATYGIGTDLFEVLATGGTPGPSITSVTPSSVMQGSSGILISIQGQNFVSGCTVTFSNYGVSIVSGPTYINDTEVQLTINVSGSAPTGEGTVTLTNPDTRYDAATFTVTGATPTVSLLDPDNATRNTQNVIVVITGSGFLSAAVVTTGGTYASTFSVDGYIYDSVTQMRVQGDIGYWTAGGDRPLYIIVTNPNGAADSALFTASKN